MDLIKHVCLFSAIIHEKQNVLVLVYIYIYIDYVSFKFKQFNFILISTLNNNLLTVHNLNLAMLKIDFIWQKTIQILQI